MFNQRRSFNQEALMSPGDKRPTFLKKSKKQIAAFIIVCNAAGKIEEGE